MKTINLTKGYVALVDDEDYARVVAVGRWHAAESRRWRDKSVRSVYAHNSRVGSLHRFILGYVGPLDVDHIDGDGLNNRKENLRVLSRRENVLAGRVSRRRDSKSCFHGVHSYPRGRWVARLQRAHKDVLTVGPFDDEVSAALAYDCVAMRERGPLAKLNFPFLL